MGAPAVPMHDWTKVEAGIFHAFHHEWISEISRTLNGGLLPSSYYALPEQVAAGFGPNVPTLQNVPPQTSREGDDPFVAGPATALRLVPTALHRSNGCRVLSETKEFRRCAARQW